MKRKYRKRRGDGYGFDGMSLSDLLRYRDSLVKGPGIGFESDAEILAALRDEIEERRREGGTERIEIRIGGASADIQVKVRE
jgi:hypothetical protein